MSPNPQSAGQKLHPKQSTGSDSREQRAGALEGAGTGVWLGPQGHSAGLGKRLSCTLGRPGQRTQGWPLGGRCPALDLLYPPPAHACPALRV